MKKIVVLFAAVALGSAFSIPASAAEWSFYGSARMSTFYVDKSEELSSDAYYPGNGLGFDDQDLTWGLQGNSRIGAKIQAGNIRGQFEYGTRVNLRILYGAWDFGKGELLVGRDYTPTEARLSHQVFFNDNRMRGFGALFSRKDMVQLTFNNLDIAFVKPKTGNIDGLDGADFNTILPMIEAAYHISLSNFSGKVFGSYNTFDIVSDEDEEYDIDTYLVAMCGRVAFGPAVLEGVFYYGQNLGLSGQPIAADSTPNYIAADDDVKDNTGYGYMIAVEYQVNQLLAFEAGYGGVSFKNDISGADRDEARAYYLQVRIQLAKNVWVVPEIGKLDFMDDSEGEDEGDVTYFGAQWKINF